MFAMATSVALQYGAPPEVLSRKLTLMDVEPRDPTANPQIPPRTIAGRLLRSLAGLAVLRRADRAGGSGRPTPPARRRLALSRPEVRRNRRHLPGLRRHAAAHRDVSDMHKLRLQHRLVAPQSLRDLKRMVKAGEVSFAHTSGTNSSTYGRGQ